MGASFPAGCVVQRCDMGDISGLSGEQSSALSCNLVLGVELG